MKEFDVHFIGEKQLHIDGLGSSTLWKKANAISNFSSPWASEKVASVEFRALWNEEKLFFQFKVTDASIHVDTTTNSYESIGNSDRVELFFRKNSELNPYYCLEMDPIPRIMDFRALPDRNFKFGWSFSKKDLLVKSSSNKQGFIVEGSISIACLKELNLINDHKIEVGVFRAKYNTNEKGALEPTWITWVDPTCETPNFHIASSFGVFHLLQS